MERASKQASKQAKRIDAEGTRQQPCRERDEWVKTITCMRLNNLRAFGSLYSATVASMSQSTHKRLNATKILPPRPFGRQVQNPAYDVSTHCFHLRPSHNLRNGVKNHRFFPLTYRSSKAFLTVFFASSRWLTSLNVSFVTTPFRPSSSSVYRVGIRWL